ncbi:MAG: hypothetical protein FWC47_15945 [Oscillospiraceae bacterium]|nr:hypothetical protein [Oscillospiraceae bacterium]
MYEKIKSNDLNSESFLYKPGNLIKTIKEIPLREFWDVKDNEIESEELYTNDKLEIVGKETYEIKPNLNGNNNKVKVTDDEVINIIDNDKILEKYLDTVETERKDSELRIATSISDFRNDLREDRVNLEQRLSKQMTDMDAKFDKVMDKMDAKLAETNNVVQETLKNIDIKFEKANDKMDAKLAETNNVVQETLKNIDIKFEKANDKMDAKLKETNDVVQAIFEKMDIKFEKTNEKRDAEIKEIRDVFQATLKSIDAKFEKTNEVIQATVKEMNIKLDKMGDKITETSVATTRWVIALVVAATISMLGMTITFLLKIWVP